MDPLANWDDLVAVKAQNPEEDLAHYFLDNKNFDSLFNDALATLQDLDVPLGYAQLPPARPAQRLGGSAHYRHAKKPSGTAIFGFLDHTRELSLLGADDLYKIMRPSGPSATPGGSISPTQLARNSAVSHEHLDFNFLEPYEQLKPVVLAEADEEPHDIIVTTDSPRLYKFPPERPEKPELKRVPIPVQEPVYMPLSSPFAEGREQTFDSPQTFDRPSGDNHQTFDRSNGENHQTFENRNYQGNLMNMNVFLPPPSTSLLSRASPEPASPLPHAYSSPLRQQIPQDKRFYNPQFFSDDADYYDPNSSALSSSPVQPTRLLQSSPLRNRRSPEPTNDDTVVDVNETILQLTPLQGQAPMTPRNNKIKLEWSPIISPNDKSTRDMKRALQALLPKRPVKKTSLLPPGELDKYWEGPDENKAFTCTFANCGKKFTRRYNVRSHIQTHLSDRPFICNFCPKSFVRQHDLNRHVKSHMVSSHCKCKCGREFTRVEGYRKHLSNGVCVKGLEDGGISKPGAHRVKTDNVLDGLTSNRLTEDLGLSVERQ